MILYVFTFQALAYGVSCLSIISSCADNQSEAWNSEYISASLRSWLKSVVTLQKEGVLQSRIYYTHGPHYDLFNDDYDDDDVDDDDDDQGVVTIGTFVEELPHGLILQWRSRRLLEGFLYGEVNSLGRFTGNNITFIYPDLETGLQGRFLNGKMEEGEAVDIIAERCKNGMKELRFMKTAPHNVTWSREEANASYIGAHPKIMDPHERKSVYIGNSFIQGANEGLFAHRKFLPGELVSYFNGVKTTEEKILYENMTEAEVEHAGAYYFGLGYYVPRSWGIAEDMMLDIPDPYRSIVEYRTTLGHKCNHKCNHKFEDTNAGFETVKHPVFGIIVCVVATEEIGVDDEIFVDYGYHNLNEPPNWYQEQYVKLY